MATQVPFLVADRLTRSYGATVALDHVDLAAAEGSVLAVLGPNGCGKTTTVRIFATLLRADSGRALVGGHDVVTGATAVRAMIGLAGQYAAVDPFLTGRENLDLIAELRHLAPGKRHRDASLLLERLGLAGQVTVLDRGRVIATGSPARLKAKVGGDHLELTVPGPEQRQAAWALLGPRAEPRVPQSPRSCGSRCAPTARSRSRCSPSLPGAVYMSATCRCTAPPWRTYSCT